MLAASPRRPPSPVDKADVTVCSPCDACLLRVWASEQMKEASQSEILWPPSLLEFFYQPVWALGGVLRSPPMIVHTRAPTAVLTRVEPWYGFCGHDSSLRVVDSHRVTSVYQGHRGNKAHPCPWIPVSARLCIHLKSSLSFYLK